MLSNILNPQYPIPPRSKLQTCFQIFLFVSAKSWQYSLINHATLSETGSLLQWGDKHSPAPWLRSIGFHTAVFWLCTTAVRRESIKTSQVHFTASNPCPYWFHTHGSAIPKNDYALQFSASMTIIFKLGCNNRCKACRVI